MPQCTGGGFCQGLWRQLGPSPSQPYFLQGYEGLERPSPCQGLGPATSGTSAPSSRSEGPMKGRVREDQGSGWPPCPPSPPHQDSHWWRFAAPWWLQENRLSPPARSEMVPWSQRIPGPAHTLLVTPRCVLPQCPTATNPHTKKVQELQRHIENQCLSLTGPPCSCVTSGGLGHLPVPQFPHPENRDGDSGFISWCRRERQGRK